MKVKFKFKRNNHIVVSEREVPEHVMETMYLVQISYGDPMSFLQVYSDYGCYDAGRIDGIADAGFEYVGIVEDGENENDYWDFQSWYMWYGD